ncbi:hypothetical protein FO519_005460 [Halicephalobus sp. NKZ332]|nr:hypothetical protein FO519_005460 [Halicephalobus sp. NKZ332]
MLGRCALLLVFAFVAVSASTLPVGVGGIPDQFKEFLPDEAKEFYADLTAEDKEILKEVALKHEEYKNEDDALNALKAKSEKLYNKAIALRNLVKEKIDSLPEEPKTFVENSITKLRGLRPASGQKPNLNELRKAAQEIIDGYKALSDSAKDSLKTAFPKITSVIQNEKFQKIAKGLLQQPAEN